MKHVYLVTSGDYSDYRVDGVFDNEEQANTLARLVDGRVDKRELNKIPKHPKGRVRWIVHLDKEGNVSYIGRETYSFEPGISLETYGERDGEIYLKLWARDEAHAIKIAGEQRRMHLAQPHGGKHEQR